MASWLRLAEVEMYGLGLAVVGVVHYDDGTPTQCTTTNSLSIPVVLSCAPVCTRVRTPLGAGRGPGLPGPRGQSPFVSCVVCVSRSLLLCHSAASLLGDSAAVRRAGLIHKRSMTTHHLPAVTVLGCRDTDDCRDPEFNPAFRPEWFSAGWACFNVTELALNNPQWRDLGSIDFVRWNTTIGGYVPSAVPSGGNSSTWCGCSIAHRGAACELADAQLLVGTVVNTGAAGVALLCAGILLHLLTRNRTRNTSHVAAVSCASFSSIVLCVGRLCNSYGLQIAQSHVRAAQRDLIGGATYWLNFIAIFSVYTTLSLISITWFELAEKSRLLKARHNWRRLRALVYCVEASFVFWVAVSYAASMYSMANLGGVVYVGVMATCFAYSGWRLSRFLRTLNSSRQASAGDSGGGSDGPDALLTATLRAIQWFVLRVSAFLGIGEVGAIVTGMSLYLENNRPPNHVQQWMYWSDLLLYPIGVLGAVVFVTRYFWDTYELNKPQRGAQAKPSRAFRSWRCCSLCCKSAPVFEVTERERELGSVCAKEAIFPRAASARLTQEYPPVGAQPPLRAAKHCNTTVQGKLRAGRKPEPQLSGWIGDGVRCLSVCFARPASPTPARCKAHVLAPLSPQRAAPWLVKTLFSGTGALYRPGT